MIGKGICDIFRREVEKEVKKPENNNKPQKEALSEKRRIK